VVDHFENWLQRIREDWFDQLHPWHSRTCRWRDVVGDEVFEDISGCGWGGFAKYVCAHENALALKPASMTFEEAAAVPQAAVLALQGLRDKRQIQSGQRVLINGAGGGVGTFAVQIAKSFGAEVTGVDSTKKLDMMRSIGADQVIDYTL
jgi:NADPH:quinone reductase-like Zn-dependent oxidoreductase